MKDNPYSGGNPTGGHAGKSYSGQKPSHLKHIPDHMLSSDSHAPAASMSHANIQGRTGGEDPQAC